MVSIHSIGTALPEHRYTMKDVENIGVEWLNNKPDQLALFRRFVVSSNVSTRHFILPPEDLISSEGMAHRAMLFEEFATLLGATALDGALKNGGISPSDLNAFLFTSCTSPSIPSADAVIVEKLNLDRRILRVPIYQHGCAGGVAGLRLASELSRVRGIVALTCVELCSLVFQRGNTNAAQLVGAAIFADGAGSVVLSPDNTGLVITAAQSYLIPNTRHLMGYDILDDGAHLKLDKSLPRALIEAAPIQINSFLAEQGLSPEKVDHWLFHPGGSKILDFFQSELCRDSRQACWSRDTFNSVGNISSATIVFVLERFLNAKICKAGEKVVMVGIGPGLTLELILFNWVTQ